MQKIGNDQVVIKAVLRKLEEPERESETENKLKKLEDLLERNPRAMKRLLNTYVIYRAIVLMKRVNVDFEKLALWTIITMRWPVLGDYLSAHPQDIKNLDKASQLPTNVTKLLELDKSEIKNVITGKNGNSLDAETIEALDQAY